MPKNDRLETIKTKIGSTGPTQEITVDDARYLLEKLAELEKKNAVLSHHVLELTEELENVKMDFGGGGR